MEKKNFTRKSLGYTFKLGDLYDAKTDESWGKNIFESDDNLVIKNLSEKVEIQIFSGDSRFEKLDILNFEHDLKLSVLLELAPTADFLSKYLSSSLDFSSIFLVYRKAFNTQTLSINPQEIAHNALRLSLKNENSTHFVSGIELGVIAIVKLSVDKKLCGEKIVEEIKAQLDYFKSKLQSLKNKKYSFANKIYRSTKFEFFANFSKTMDPKPKNLDEVYAYLCDLKPHDVVPISYALTPLTGVVEPTDNMTLSPINEKLLSQILILLEHIDEGERLLKGFQKKLHSFVDCVPNYALEHVDKKVIEHNKFITILKDWLKNLVQQLRSGQIRDVFDELQSLFEQYYKGHFNRIFLKKFVDVFSDTSEKIEYIRIAQAQAVRYIGKTGSLAELKVVPEFYVFYGNWSNQDVEFVKNRALFNTVVGDDTVMCFIVDAEFYPNFSEAKKIEENHLYYVDKGVYKNVE